MTFSAVTERGSATEKVSDTSIAVSPSANLTVDKIVFVRVVTDNAATTAGASTNHDTLADTDGNTWNKVYERTQSAGAANDGVTHSLWWAKVATQIDTSDSIAFTGDTAVTAKVIMVWEVTIGAGNTIQVAGTPQFLEVAATNNPAALTISGLPSKEYLFLGGMAVEEEYTVWVESSSDAFTNVFASEGVTSGPAGTPTSNVAGFAGYRIATATGATFDVGSIGAADAALALVAFEEVSTGTNHTANPADALGLLDSTSQVTDSVRTQDDPLGLTDAAAQVTTSVRDQTDPLGLTDSVTYQHDAVGEQSFTDPLGLTDSIAAAQNHVRDISDSLGLVDDGEWVAIGVDQLGLLDTISVEQGHDRTQTDSLGLTDSVTYDLTSGGVAHTVTISDSLGLVDAAATTMAIDVTLADLLGLVDSQAQAANYNVALTDSLGLDDEIVTSLTQPGFWTRDPVGYTKAPVGFVRVGPDDTPPWP